MKIFTKWGDFIYLNLYLYISLVDDEIELLALFRKLNKKNQQRAIGVLMSFEEFIN